MKRKPPQIPGIALGCPRSCFRSVVRSHRPVVRWRQPRSIHLGDEHGCIQLVDAGGETTRRREPRGVSGTLEVSPTGSTNSGVRARIPVSEHLFANSGVRIPVSEGVRIPVSEHLFAWRTTTTARLRDDAEAMGNDLDPVLCTVGPATAHRRPHAIQLLGRLFPTDLPSPAGPTFRLSATELLPFRERVQEGIGMPGAMAAVARPGILARIGHHRGPHRVGLDVPQNDEQVVAVLDDRGSEAALPDVAAGSLSSGGLSQEGGFPGGSLWTILLEMCSIVGELTPISIDGGSPMSTITQRIASAFVVLCGRYGDVTKMAHDREQSRQSLYREASQVANAVDGTAVQSRIDELQRQLAGQQAQIQDLQERLEHAIEITRDKQDEFASVAQAEGVSLSVARRLLQVVAGSVTTPSVPTLGRATEEAGQRAGQLLEVIDEVAQPKVKQATADEIFLGPNRS